MRRCQVGNEDRLRTSASTTQGLGEEKAQRVLEAAASSELTGETASTVIDPTFPERIRDFMQADTSNQAYVSFNLALDPNQKRRDEWLKMADGDRTLAANPQTSFHFAKTVAATLALTCTVSRSAGTPATSASQAPSGRSCPTAT